MSSTFIVAWTGGYEMPTYFATPDQDEAEAKFAEWLADRKDESDTIQILEVSEDGRTIEALKDDQDVPDPEEEGP